MSVSALFPAWALPALIFAVALGITLGAASRYARLLEQLSDYEHMPSELLGFLSALGANIPNYVASLAAFVSGHGLVGLGIIVGSNIYNIAVILGLAAFATPNGRGINLTHTEAQEVRRLAWLAVIMGGLTLVIALLSTLASPPLIQGPPELLLNLLILFLFALLVRDALRPAYADAPAPRPAIPDTSAPSPLRVAAMAMLALSITLVGVIIMVQSGQAAAAEVHLSPVILSLVVLAVATSLPNTVVAYQLARTSRASASVEEILSSNAINIALGSALPLLFFAKMSDFHNTLLTHLDLPLLCILGLIIAVLIPKQHISRLTGLSLFAIYVLWIAVHIFLSTSF